eukprot:SAG31_NODE_4673_length_3042_cov_1.601427_1_plen_866_part_10
MAPKQTGSGDDKCYDWSLIFPTTRIGQFYLGDNGNISADIHDVLLSGYIDDNLDSVNSDEHHDKAGFEDAPLQSLIPTDCSIVIGFICFLFCFVTTYGDASVRFAWRKWSNLVFGGILLLMLMFEPVAEGSMSATLGNDPASSVVRKMAHSFRRALQHDNELTPYAPIGCDLDAALQILATADGVCCLGLAQTMPWPIDPTNKNGVNKVNTSCTEACSIECATALLPLQSGFISKCSPMIDAILDGDVLDARTWVNAGGMRHAEVINDMVAQCSADIRATDVLARLLTLSKEGQCEANGISLNGVAEQFVSSQGAVPPPPQEGGGTTPWLDCADTLGPSKCATAISSGRFSCEDDFCRNCLLSGNCDQTCGICSRHRRELGSWPRSLQSAMPCSATDFVALAAEVTTSCCNDLEGNCDSGVATSCDAECGAIFVPFFAACFDALTTFQPTEMGAMAALDATCRALPVVDLLAAVTYCEGETAMACPEIQPPANLEVAYSSRELVYMSTVTYTARPGFTLVGNASFTCLINGSWSGEPYARFGYTYVHECVAVLARGMEGCFVYVDHNANALGSISVHAEQDFIISALSLTDLEDLMDRPPEGYVLNQVQINFYIQADFAVGGALTLAGVQAVGGTSDGIQISVEAGGQVNLQNVQMERGQVTASGVVNIAQSSLVDVELVGSSGSALNVNGLSGAVALSVEADSSCSVHDSPDLVLSGSVIFSGQGIVGQFADTALEQMSLLAVDHASLLLHSVSGSISSLTVSDVGTEVSLTNSTVDVGVSLSGGGWLSLQSVDGSISGLAVANSTFAMDAASTATLEGTIRFENAGSVELAGKTIRSGSSLAVSGTELTLQSTKMESGQVSVMS